MIPLTIPDLPEGKVKAGVVVAAPIETVTVVGAHVSEEETISESVTVTQTG